MVRRHGKASVQGAALVAVLVLAGCGARAAGEVSTAAEADPPQSTMPTDPTSTTTSSTSTSTTSTSTSTTTTSTTTPPPAVADPGWHFDGQHRGIEHFALQTDRCPFLDHQLQETFTLSDGTTWGFTARYCGTIDADGFWTGAGSFEMAIGADASFAGTFVSAAQLPSTGEPYQLDVRSGTGRFAGATGACRLENHLRVISFGVQEQSGAFACDLHH